LALLDDVTASPASRRLASAHAALGTRHILILGQAPREISEIAPSGLVCYFFRLPTLRIKEGTVGTTKLTRKEILAEDPVHEAIIQLIEYFRENGKKIGIATAIVVFLALGIYSGLQYLKGMEAKAQESLGKGIEYFHAQVAADATDDPYGKGSSPTFRSDLAKYKAAAKEFSSIVDGHNFGKITVTARYYLGLSQLQMGQKQEAIRNLESVSINSKERTLGYLAKKILATEYAKTGNYKGARDILDSMIKDPQCQLPKEDLSLQLSRVLVSQGKRDEAIKVLRDASSQGAAFSAYQQQLTTELDKLQKTPVADSNPQQARP
jgi:predicted negative regulator of RcsB-dependent stress response